MTLFLSYITDMKEGQKEYQGGSRALDQTPSQQSAMNPQPGLDSTVPVPVSRGMVEVEMSMHSLFCSLDKAQIVYFSLLQEHEGRANCFCYMTKERINQSITQRACRRYVHS